MSAVSVVRKDAMLEVWLNRPQVHNALNEILLQELLGVFQQVEDSPDIRVVTLKGAGPSFCSGADRMAPPGFPDADNTIEKNRRRMRLGQRVCRAIEDSSALTIARVHGRAYGGGLLLALACDFRVGADTCVLQLPEVNLGIHLGWGGVPRLIGEVGAARARQLLMLGEEVSGSQAYDWGLLHRVVSEDDLDEAAADLADRLLTKPGAPMSTTKQQFKAYAAAGRLGDLSHFDGDALMFAFASLRENGDEKKF